MMSSQIVNLLEKFNPIALVDMDRVKLMNRIDTKFAFDIDTLIEILPELGQHYDALDIEGVRASHYESMYFDDDKLTFFKDHHVGKTNRFKVRIRKYVETNTHFLEIKHKFKGRTNKKRINSLGFTEDLDANQKEFLDGILNKEIELQSTLKNAFQRITLVHKTKNERLTLDFNLKFYNETKSVDFKHLIIAELKQESLDRSSPFFIIMKKRMIRPYRLSKYCIGTMELYGDQNLKYNRFKRKYLYLKKIENYAA